MSESGELRRLERRLARERAARLEAETIGERVTAEQFAALSELMASRAVLDETPDYVGICDPTGRASYLNRALREMLGLNLEESREVTLTALLSPDSRTVLEQEALPTIRSKGVWRGELALVRPNGGQIPVSQVLIGHVDEAGALRHLSFVARDVTEERQLTDLLAHRSSHDVLTGLPNRRALHEALDTALAQARDARCAPPAVLFLDLDGFKAVNDGHGHGVGDALLVAVAERLSACARDRDLLARVGGDEFVMVCHEIHSPEQADVIARRLIAAISSPFELAGRTVHIGLSVGVACGLRPGVTSDGLVRLADEAMYDAKHAGRGVHRVAVLGPS